MGKPGRPKKAKAEENEPIIEAKKVKDDPILEKKSLFRIDEVARYFNVSERTIRLWIEHGHLVREKVVGTTQISRESILRCRFRGIGATLQ